MDKDTLRALQAPIKDKYRAEPEAAVITLKAQGALDETAIACKVETGRAMAIRLFFDLETSAAPEAISQLIKLTERYCVVYQTLNKRPDLQVLAQTQ